MGKPADDPLRARCLHILRHELVAGQPWERVHAAEALIEHGETSQIADIFVPLVATAQPPYRIGVWRVVARIAKSPEEGISLIDRIRAVFRDPASPDRVHAAESLAKLAAAEPADRQVVDAWLQSADAVTSVYLRWLSVQLSDDGSRGTAEVTLAAFLDSRNPDARLCSGYALARLKNLSPAAMHLLAAAVAEEPTDSPAYPYLLAAMLTHERNRPAAVAGLKTRLHACLENGLADQQLEIAQVIGRVGDRSDIPSLAPLIDAKSSDARIGGASGLLHILQPQH